MMIFDKYEQLSEDAQRLMCYFAEIALATHKRMSEHFYMLRHYCFPVFNGDAALAELKERHILLDNGRDWYLGTEQVVMNPDDIVPALWYLYEERKDLLLAMQKCKHIQNTAYIFVRYAVKQLVDSGYTACASANVISAEHADLFFSVAQEGQFQHLFENLQPEAFERFFAGVSGYFIENDTVADTTLLTTVLQNYVSISEMKRCQFIASMELYEYVANGCVPSEGLYANIAEGYLLGGLRHLNSGKYTDAVRWFEMAMRVQQHNKQETSLYKDALLSFYIVTSYMNVINEDAQDSHEIVEMCRNRLDQFLSRTEPRTRRELLPARILAEDFTGASQRLHKQQVENLYSEADRGTRPALFRHLAFLLANYLGYSTAGMDVNLCIPKLTLLRHEMSKYLPLYDSERETLRHIYGDKPPLQSIYHKAEWEFVLEDLMHEASGSLPQDDEQETRLMYIRESMDSTMIHVREQTRLKNGNWGNGKRLSDTRYMSGEVECMNNADRRILARLMHSMYGALQLEHVVEEMADDQRLYFGKSAPFEKVRVTRDKPYLIVENEGGRFVIKSNVPVGKAKDDIVVVEETPTSYTLLNIPNEIREYYVKLLQLGSLPLEAEPTLRSLLKTIGGKVELHSSLIEGGSTLPIVDGQWNVGFRLTPKSGGNWEIEPFVRPLPNGRRTYPPAEGDDVIIDENEEGRVRVRRDMQMELSNKEVVCNFWREKGTEYKARDIYPPEFLLDLVQMIQENSENFYAEWEEGQNIKVKHLGRGVGSWNGVVKQRGLWFDIEGNVDIDEQTTMSISQLLELAGKSRGKYIKLSDGEFLTLSDKLRMQLKALDAIANRERGTIKISPFSAALMGEELLNGELSLKLDDKVKETRQRIIDGSSYTPEVPRELNATLRPYQKDGFLWMARLNSWGAGALLADDMGLGKTIQTIAFLLLKKDEGASLVVAPASVAPNWKTELEKFAPTLNVQILNFSTDRAKTISEAKAGDVVIATYGILLSIQEMITEKHWNVACLDEAHIIKNRGAKTSAAAMKIKANNRVMLTGTPVQNHLGELWSLFQFVNPGLLGGYEHFSQKFIVPIEGYHDKEKQEQLENIVHPFMLRRTKQAVLKELPEKTEIYHTVEQNKDELAIYESIRRRAEKMLREQGDDIDMNVLAEITRLRQAACCAQLIEPKWQGESTKITALVELLQGVIEGGNRALVFSQFVSFFNIVRRELEQRGMDYFYIDGSVPVKRRTEMVNDFQKGNKQIFLISLKAGGLGLNLTGANYVFHLDPWWNPAIEQQATDRAYRIGQNQAVTVYHLVSKNTIEEKIIRLHQAKRNLAENILAGTDSSHKLTGKDLLEMVAKN